MTSHKTGRTLLAAAALILCGTAVLAFEPACAARPAEGGENARTHKLLGAGRSATRCRICAGKSCTVVTVRGACTKERALDALRLRQKRKSQRRMPLNPPILDDRNYDGLEKDSKGHVPRHTPEWSDHNESDPGMAILETARRHPNLVRVRPVSPSRRFRPEPDDEVLMNFEHRDGK